MDVDDDSQGYGKPEWRFQWEFFAHLHLSFPRSPSTRTYERELAGIHWQERRTRHRCHKKTRRKLRIALCYQQRRLEFLGIRQLVGLAGVWCWLCLGMPV